MRLTGIKAMACATILALAGATSASASWPYYSWGGWYGGYWPGYAYTAGYWPAYSYWNSGYGYYPYRTAYYGSYPGYYSYYSPYSYSYPYYYSYAPSYVVPSTVVATAPVSTTYTSFYPAYTTASAPEGNTAVVQVRTEPGAELWFNGVRTNQTGELRTFATPELQAGKSFSYDVKVRWNEGDRPMERTKTIAVAAGETVNVDLTRANLSK